MKIVARPGVIRSKKDGQLCYVDFKSLWSLYKIPKSIKVEVYNPRQHYPEDTVFLNPLPEGNYEEIAKELNLWKVD